MPVISAINGPVVTHSETPLLADVVLAAETTVFQDATHFLHGLPPGDGMHTIWTTLLGLNRGRHFLLTGRVLTAREALEYGVVGEVLPREDLLPRAWELATTWASFSPATLRGTRAAVTAEWRRLLHEQLHTGLTHEAFAGACASVILLQKAPTVGGTTAMSVGAFTAAGTSLQKTAGIADSVDEFIADMQSANGPLDSRENHQLRQVLAEQAAPTLEWLIGMGVRFLGPFPAPPNRHPRMHNVLPNSRSFTAALAVRARKLGVRIETNRRAEELLTDDDHRVIGVRAGSECHYAAKGVVIATGDYTASADLVSAALGGSAGTATAASGRTPAATADCLDDRPGRRPRATDIAWLCPTCRGREGDRAAALRFPTRSGDQRGTRDLPVDHIAGDVGELAVMVTRVCSQQFEGVAHRYLQVLGEHSLGLLDDHPAVQGGLELLSQQAVLPERLFLDQSDCRHFRHGLRYVHLVMR